MNDLTERKKISLASILSSIEDSGIQEVKEPGTRLKNRFYVFLDTEMSGYNLSSILEQVTTGFRVPGS